VILFCKDNKEKNKSNDKATKKSKTGLGKGKRELGKELTILNQIVRKSCLEVMSEHKLKEVRL
jgi:hypothetical protein